MNQLIALDDLSHGLATPAAPIIRQNSRMSPISIEIRPLSACGEIRQDWADLASRALASNLFFEPDFSIAATQHLVAFRQAAAILAWQGPAGDPRRRLVGLIPCFPRNGLFVPDALIGFSNERILDGAPLLDSGQAQAVLAAVLGLRQGWTLEGRGLVLRRLDLDGPLVSPLLRAAEERGLTAALRPTSAAPSDVLPFIRPRDHAGALSLREATTRTDIRDAVEILLAIEASGPRGRNGTATLQDTREVGFLRAMTRGLARTRQCRLALLTLEGEPIAAALILGQARRSFLYLAAEDEAHAGLAPLHTLLAMLQQVTPNRPILNSPGTGHFGELRLTPQAARRPRDLASRARDALQRSFRLGRAANGG